MQQVLEQIATRPIFAEEQDLVKLVLITQNVGQSGNHFLLWWFSGSRWAKWRIILVTRWSRRVTYMVNQLTEHESSLNFLCRSTGSSSPNISTWKLELEFFSSCRFHLNKTLPTNNHFLKAEESFPWDGGSGRKMHRLMDITMHVPQMYHFHFLSV